MKLQVTRSGDDIAKLINELPGRIQAVGVHLGRTIAKNALELVKKKLTSGGEWIGTYRNAIQAFESSDSTQFVVAGFNATPAPPANSETTLVVIAQPESADPISAAIAQVMIPYNPWTIDTLPPIGESYYGLIQTHGAAAVETERARLRGLVALVSGALETAGATLLTGAAGTKSKINGTFYTDIVWLAKRLEIGAGGFPKRPHWKPAGNATAKSGLAWGRDQSVRVGEIIQGGASTRLPEATTAQLSDFAAKRAVDL